MRSIRYSLAEKERRQNKNNTILSTVLFTVIMILLFVIVMNVFVYMTVEVDGSSMYPTLYDGDVLKVNKLIEPSRGDIVIIKKYSEDKGKDILVVKRVIALGGDTIRIEDGAVYLNGEALSEDYVKDDPKTVNIDESKTPDWSEDGILEYTLDEDEIFYLGDNRWNSVDSRKDGCCKEKDIVGVLESWAYGMRGFFKLIH